MGQKSTSVVDSIAQIKRPIILELTFLWIFKRYAENEEDEIQVVDDLAYENLVNILRWELNHYLWISA